MPQVGQAVTCTIEPNSVWRVWRTAGGQGLVPLLVALTAALVPAIASVQPAEPERKASPALKSAMAEMREVEERIEPHIAEIEDIEVDMAPIIEEIEAMEAEIDHEAIARQCSRGKALHVALEFKHILHGAGDGGGVQPCACTAAWIPVARTAAARASRMACQSSAMVRP